MPKKNKVLIKAVFALLITLLSSGFSHDADPTAELSVYSLYGEDFIWSYDDVKTPIGDASGGWSGTGGAWFFKKAKITSNGPVLVADSLTFEENPWAGSTNFIESVTASKYVNDAQVTYSSTKSINSVTAPTFPSYTVSPGTTNCNSNGVVWDCTGGAVLPAGKYGQISVDINKSGILEDGVYEIQSLVVKDAKLEITKAADKYTRILVSDSMVFHSAIFPDFPLAGDTSVAGSGAELVLNDTLQAGTVLLYYSGLKTSYLVSGSEFHASVVAPNAKIVAETSTKLVGQILAKSVNLKYAFDGTLGKFVPFNPAGVKLVGASTFVLDEEMEDSNYKTRKSKLVTIPVQLSSKTVKAGSLQYEIRSAGSKYGSIEILTLGTDSNTSDLVYSNYGASAATGTLNYAIDSINPSVLLKVWVVDDSLRELDAGDTSYLELKLHTPLNLQFELDPDAEYADADSLIYKIPLVSDDPANRTPTRVDSILDIELNEDFASFDINTRLDTLFSDADGDSLFYRLSYSSQNWGNASVNDSTLSYSLVADSNGVDSLIIYAEDPSGEKVYDTVVVTVNPVNDAPALKLDSANLLSFSSGYKIEFPEESLKSNEDFVLVDSLGPQNESDAVKAFSITTSDPSFFKAGPSVDVNGKLSFELNDNIVDSTWLFVKLFDTGDTLRGGVDSSLVDSVFFVITNVNDVPVLDSNLADISLQEDFADTLAFTNLSALISDVDGDTLDSLQVNVLGSVLGVASVIGDSIQLSSKLNENGLDSLEVLYFVGVDTLKDTVQVTVTAVNDLPVLDSSLSVVTLAEDFSDTLVVNGLSSFVSDVDGETLDSVRLTVLSSVLDSSWFVSDAISLSSKLSQNGRDSVEVVYFVGVDSLKDTLNVIVTPVNDIPVLDSNLADISLQEDFADTLAFTNLSSLISDVDGDILDSLQVNVLGSILGVGSVIGDSIQLSSKLNENGLDSLEVLYFVGVDTLKDTVQVTVTAVNDLPVLDSSLSVVTLAEDFSDTLVVNGLSSFVSDVDGETLDSVRLTVLSSVLDSSWFVSDAISLSSKLSQNGRDSVEVVYFVGVDSLKDTLNVIVTPVNDVPVLDSNLADISLQEDFADTLAFTNLSSLISDVDGDTLDSVQVSVLGSILGIGSVIGDSIQLSSKLNENGLDSLEVLYFVGVDTLKDTVQVTVTAVNDLPLLDSSLSMVTLAEDFSDTLVVNGLSSFVSDVDGETLDSVRLTVLSSVLDSTWFVNDAISLSSKLSQNGRDSVEVVYFVGVDSLKDTLNVIVTPVNDVPVLDSNLADISLQEDFADTLAFTNLSALISDVDGDTLDSIQVSVLGSVLGLSSVLSDSIVLASSLNAYGTDSLEVIYFVGLDVLKDTVQVGITAVNDAPDSMSLSNNQIAENSAIGSFVGNFNVFDVDNQTTDFNFTIGTNSYFTIQNDSLVTTSELDYEAMIKSGSDSVEIIVTATDKSDSLSSILDTFYIQVLDRNDPPFRVGDLSDIDSLYEDFSDTTLISFLDTLFFDPEGQSLSYELILGDSTLLQVNVNTDSNSIGFKSNQDKNGTTWLIVIARDPSGNEVSDTLNILVNPVNDRLVTKDTTGSVKENVNDDSVVGVVIVTDVDGDSISYQISDSTTHYVIDENGQIRLKDSIKLDYEKSPIDTISVIVSDGIMFDTIQVVINVQNEIENSVVTIVQAVDSSKTWTSKLDTIWMNSDSITMTYSEDGVSKDSVVSISTDILETGYGIQTVVHVYHNETKDNADTVTTYVVYNNVDPVIVLDTTKFPLDSTGLVYINDIEGTLDFNISSRDSDPVKVLSLDTNVVGPLSEGVVTEWVVTYTDKYGNTQSDTIRVILDTTAPNVQIVKPTDKYVLTSLYTPVDWEVEGQRMFVDTTETLVEGPNVIVRSFTDFAGNTGYDTVHVTVVIEGNKVGVSLVNEVVNLKKDGEGEFQQKVEEYYGNRGREDGIPQDESWNLSLQVPDDYTGEFTEYNGYMEMFYHDGSKKVERDEASQTEYTLSADRQIGISIDVEMQFPVLNNGIVKSSGDVVGVCEDGEYMWELSVNQIKVVIYDQMGQFVRAELIEGFDVDPKYQSVQGKVNARFDMPSLETDIRADDGRKWAAGIYLMHVQVQTTADGINCNVGEKEVSRIGTMKRQGYIRE